MQDDFEKKVRDRVTPFGIQPSPQVWEEVGAVLQKKGRRRIFAGWWILLGLAVLGGLVFLREQDAINQQKLNQQQPVTADTATNNTALSPKTLPPVSDKTKNEADNNSTNAQPLAANAQSDKHTQPQKVSTSSLPEIKNENNNRAYKANKNVQANSEQTDGVPGKNIQAAAGNTQHATNMAASAPKQDEPAIINASPAKDGNNVSDAKKDADGIVNATPPAKPADAPAALLNSRAEAAVIIKKNAVDSGAANNATNQAKPSGLPKKAASGKNEWYLTFSAGTTQTIAPAGGFNTPTTIASLPYTTSLSQGFVALPGITAASAYNQYNISQPGVGFNISAGGLYERRLSRRWKISAGLAFSYLENTQKTGAGYNYPYNANYLYNLSTQSYYQPGTTSTAINKAWQMQAPVNIGYTFNPSAKTKFMFTGGLSFAWLFSSQWLIPDAHNNKLYYSNTVFNSKTLNWQVGPALQLPNNWQVGLQYQQSFTTLAKTYITPKLYWQNISIYTAIPLGKRKKH